MEDLGPMGRTKLASAAHAAVRGVDQSEEHRRRIALSREASGYGGTTSSGTDWLCRELTGLGIEHVREKAVGRYNLDIALSSSAVAVEVLGGNWHGAKPIHAVRTPYVLNAGWHIVFVWDTKRCKVGAGALDYIVALAQQSSLDPTATREYRVIRGDGEFISAGSADDEEFPFIPSSVRNLRRRTIDES
jgi:very-short-patch-repair endonuclease